MKQSSKRMALAGMMAALATAAMLLGGAIPMATFCCPAIAGLALVPILAECGVKWTLTAYAAAAALSLILSPDKESALLFAFLGWYPAMKSRMDRIRPPVLGIVCKLGAFDLACGAMLALSVFSFGMQGILDEYMEMTKIGLIIFILLANFTMLVYDRLLILFYALYLRKIRPILKFH